MKNNHKTIWKCATKCGRQTSTLHEVIFRARNRQNCIDYNIQLPLCTMCHQVAHGRFLLNGHSPLLKYTRPLGGNEKVIDQERIARMFLHMLGLSYSPTLLALNDKHKMEYLEMKKDKCLEIIKSYEMCYIF